MKNKRIAVLAWVIGSAFVVAAMTSAPALACRATTEIPEMSKALSGANMMSSRKAEIGKALDGVRAVHDKAHADKNRSKMKQSLAMLDEVKATVAVESRAQSFFSKAFLHVEKAWKAADKIGSRAAPSSSDVQAAMVGLSVPAGLSASLTLADIAVTEDPKQKAVMTAELVANLVVSNALPGIGGLLATGTKLGVKTVASYAIPFATALLNPDYANAIVGFD